jgi:hypothetical protein
MKNARGMDNEIIICDKCLSDLSHFLKNFYIKVCYVSFYNGLASMNGLSYLSCTPILTSLERKGYVVSTEIDKKNFSVKPTGHEIKKNGNILTHNFCCKRNKHKISVV